MKPILFSIICLFSLNLTKGQQINHFKTTDGETLYYTSLGKGQRVILLYGGPGFGVGPMRNWADSLANQFECILFEQRGTGLSSKAKLDSTTINLKKATQDIEDLRVQLGEKQLTICGISWGEMLAQAYASYFPANTKNIVLVSTLGPDLSLGSVFNDNMNMRRFPEERDSLTYWNKQPDSDLSKMKRDYFNFISEFYDHEIGYKMLQKFFATTQFYETMSNLMWNDLSLSYDLKPILIKYKGKCSIIRPRQDPVPAESIYQIKELLPQTNIYFVEKSGHFPDYEKPKELFKILRQVL
jgi:proline iminopeptidase